MAKKDNRRARDLDLSSFAFVTATCGGCHPGGGPLEHDRAGRRYDEFAASPESGIVSGADNNFDGDYYQARWAETGVIEADCLICHLPSYDHAARRAQIGALNFRWAATAGAGFGRIEGEVKNGEQPKVVYDPKLFAEGGLVALNIVRNVPAKSCLACHQETDWKKKGAAYSPRTDVHMRAGLRCGDCHLAGSRAEDKRIRGKEAHQFGKGDCPGGVVRDDLDNTVRECRDCHTQGTLGAPLMRHRGLPPRHLDRLACQSCHIPQRQVKAALIQDSTVWNATPRIEPAARRIWSFYGPDARPWNYYGEVAANTAAHQPLDGFRPVVGWYKGRIFPLSRLYSVWVGLEREGEPGLGQPYMSDMLSMWQSHLADPRANYPQLAQIRDDNLDGFPEVNRAGEIEAVIGAVKAHLRARGADLTGQRVVFVKGSEVYYDGRTRRQLAGREHEVSPYGSVFKLSHDVAPARSALGAGGCTDCHARGASFFFQPVLADPWDAEGQAHFEPNYRLLGYSPAALTISLLLEERLKPIVGWGLLAAVAALGLLYAAAGLRAGGLPGPWERSLHYGLLVAFLGPGIILLFGAQLASETIGALAEAHRYLGATFLAVVLWVGVRSGLRGAGWLGWVLLAATLAMAATGGALIVASGFNLRQPLLGLHILGAAGLLAAAALGLARRLLGGGS